MSGFSNSYTFMTVFDGLKISEKISARTHLKDTGRTIWRVLRIKRFPEANGKHQKTTKTWSHFHVSQHRVEDILKDLRRKREKKQGMFAWILTVLMSKLDANTVQSNFCFSRKTVTSGTDSVIKYNVATAHERFFLNDFKKGQVEFTDSAMWMMKNYISSRLWMKTTAGYMLVLLLQLSV